jgi:hypothetical protein
MSEKYRRRKKKSICFNQSGSRVILILHYGNRGRVSGDKKKYYPTPSSARRILALAKNYETKPCPNREFSYFVTQDTREPDI